MPEANEPPIQGNAADSLQPPTAMEAVRRYRPPAFLRFFSTLILVLVLISTLGLYFYLHDPESDGKIHLRYMAWGTPQQRQTDRAVLDMFEAQHPNVKVDFIVAPSGQYFQKVQIMLASHTEPDVFRVDAYNFSQYAELGYFTPLNDIIASDQHFSLDDFVSQAIEEVTLHGKIYGLNALFGGKLIYYNKDLFEKAGVEDPWKQYQEGRWNMQAFLEAARKLTVRSGGDLPPQVGFNGGTDDLWWMLWCFGGDVVTPDGQIRIADPQSIQALTFFANLRHVEVVMPRPTEAALSVFTFESGNIGMQTGFAGESPRYRERCRFRWDIVPVPSGPAGRFSIVKGNGLVMSKNTRHRAEAWELMKFMTSVEVEKIYCGDQLRRSTPMRKSVFKSSAFLVSHQQPYQIEAFMEMMRTGRRLPISPTWSEWLPVFNRWVDRMMTDNPTRRVSPETAAVNMKKEIEKAVKEADY